ncbi:MAG: U32 family peptidase [Oscillospiraceae bacterium]|nr:U32 family peptidase [Oscillospiraceae bacterium]
MTKPELLSPARDAEQLIMALTFGADAVYMGGLQFGLRASAGNFGSEDMAEAIKVCHSHGVRAYITCNAVMNNDDAHALPAFLEELESAGADAVIVSDIGALALSRKYAPSVEAHISTQAGVFNFETAKALHAMGASRVILARELTLKEIAVMRENIPQELELEAFVHGAMCVAISGRCLLSSYLTGRDANKGACAQPCRWKYSLVEHQRPGEYFDITEGEGTYIMNSRDLCLIDHIKELTDAGLSSLKIEGRMKSAYYAAAITNAYRKAIDAAASAQPLKEVWRNEVNKVSHREYSTGFYFDPGGPGQYHGDSMYRSDCDVVAVVESCDNEGNAVLSQRNKFFKGDTVELLTPNDEPVSFTAETILGADGKELDSTPHAKMKLQIKLPFFAPQYSILRKSRI